MKSAAVPIYAKGLTVDLPIDVSIVCYADVTLVLAQGSSHQAAANATTFGVSTITERIQQLGLNVAIQQHKLEAMCFHGHVPPPASHIMVGGVHIGVGSTKYLGLVLDSWW